MTQLLEQAIAELNKLPAPDQDALAALILAEINDERRWETAFANSQDQLVGQRHFGSFTCRKS